MSVEELQIFDRTGRALGLCPRHVVHTEGHWHKSAQVFLFNEAGELLIQQRAFDKDLYAGLWDYSVGEHLKPDEDFLAGALRGLAEELGVTNVALSLLGGVRQVTHKGVGFFDREIQQAFAGVVRESVTADRAEVAQVRFISLDEIRLWVADNETDFTPWFVQDMHEFGYLETPDEPDQQ